MDEVRLFCLRPEQAADPAVLVRSEALLSTEERRRHDRFVFAEGRRQFLLGRALVRAALSRVVPVPPETWAFRVDARGRPEVVSEPGTPPLRFSLSHTEGFLACVVALERAVGVDVEDAARRGELVDIAEHSFSPREVEALRALPESDRRPRFFEYWTLKEAYVKARGLGLSLDLGAFSILMEPPAGIGIAFDSGIDDTPARWQFALLHPTPRHTVAVCMERRTPGEAVGVAVEDLIPSA